MMTVWKYVLEKFEYQQVEMPAGATLLSARDQGEDVCVWALCDPSQPLIKRTFLTAMTGHQAPAPHEATYLGTAMLLGGRFVLHVFVKPIPC